MAKNNTKLSVRLSSIFQANGRLITFAAIAVILFGGATLIQDPERWWIVSLVVLGFFLGVFLLFNAAIVIKIIFAIGLTVLYGALSFQFGIAIEPETSGGFIWMFGVLAVFFGSLSLSYFIPSGQSRWTVIILVETIYFFGVFLIMDFGNDLTLVSGAGIITALILYGVLFRFGFKSGFSDEAMPAIIRDSILDYSIPLASAYADMDSRAIIREDFTSYIVWNERAYLIIPIKLNQAFGIMGRKKTQLSYNGKPINAWLRYMIFKYVPHRKARNADIMLVLADTTNANGTEPKVMGVSLADSKAVVPVGVLPSKLLMTKDEPALKKALSRLDPHFESYVDNLNEKQKDTLEDFGEISAKEKSSK